MFASAKYDEESLIKLGTEKIHTRIKAVSMFHFN